MIILLISLLSFIIIIFMVIIYFIRLRKYNKEYKEEMISLSDDFEKIIHSIKKIFFRLL